MTNGELEDSRITEQIIGAAFEVHNTLGYGFLERVYQNAMAVELRSRGLPTDIEPPLQVRYKGSVVGDYRADLLVARRIIVEIKVAATYQRSDEAQLLNELRASGLRLGMLINFGKEKVEFKRMIF